MDTLSLLKISLGITGTGYDERLQQMIDAAQDYIATEGINIDQASDGDTQIVVMYAEYLWRKRESGEEMPRMLRRVLNNRLFSQKMR